MLSDELGNNICGGANHDLQMLVVRMEIGVEVAQRFEKELLP